MFNSLCLQLKFIRVTLINLLLAGSVEVFEYDGSVWATAYSFVPLVADTSNKPKSVAVYERTVVMGAEEHDESIDKDGAIYIHYMSPTSEPSNQYISS